MVKGVDNMLIKKQMPNLTSSGPVQHHNFRPFSQIAACHAVESEACSS